MRTLQSRRAAFTGVELVVTIVIVAILATIAVVGYRSTQARVWRGVLTADLRNWTAESEPLRMSGQPGWSQVHRLSRGITQDTMIVRPDGYLLVLEHAPTSQRCWVRFATEPTLVDERNPQCGEPPAFAAAPTGPPPDPAQSTVTALPASIGVGESSTIAVSVRDASGTPIAGAPVVLTVSSGTLTPPEPTDAGGQALGMVVGTAPGVITVSATVNGVALTSTATITVGSRMPVSLVVLSGNGQRGPPSMALPTPVRVAVYDETWAALPGRTVAWSVLSGGGSPSPATVTTTALGQASVTWTLGASGTQTLRASIDALTASASATLQVFTSLVAVGPTTITAPSGFVLAPLSGPVVEARDQDGQAMPGVSITWSRTSGTFVTLGTPLVGVTGADGRAAAPALTMSTDASTRNNTVRATAAGPRTVDFAVNLVNASTLVRISGGAEPILGNSAWAAPIVIEARRADASPYPNVLITCTGPGSSFAFTQSTPRTGTDGRVTLTGSFLNSWGSATITCSSTGASNATTAFVRLTGPAVTYAGIPQSWLRGSLNPTPIRVRLLASTTAGTPAFQGARVSCTINTGSATGSRFEPGSRTADTLTVGSDGWVSLSSIRLDPASYAASSTMLSCLMGTALNPGIDATSFSQSLSPLRPVSMSASAGNNQRVGPGALVGGVQVRVLDQFGAGLAEVPVTFTSVVASGGAPLPVWRGPTPVIGLTNSSGILALPDTAWQVSNSLISGHRFQTLNLSVAGCCGNAVSAEILVPWTSTRVSGTDPWSLAAGLSWEYSAVIFDQYGSPLRNVPITSMGARPRGTSSTLNYMDATTDINGLFRISVRAGGWSGSGGSDPARVDLYGWQWTWPNAGTGSFGGFLCAPWVACP